MTGITISSCMFTLRTKINTPCQRSCAESRCRTGLPKQHRLVKWVGGYCVFGFIVTQVLFLGVWCRPIQQYWWVPVVNSKSREETWFGARRAQTDPLLAQCASYYHHLITASVFNISSDLIMLLIPIPLLIKAHLPLKRYVRALPSVHGLTISSEC